MPSHTLLCELFYGGVWNPVPVRTGATVTIRNGRNENASDVMPAAAALTFDDLDGLKAPTNPLSPLFPTAGRNIPIRLTVDGSVRAVDEVAGYTPHRSPGFDPLTRRGDQWVEVEAAGILRRLGQGDTPLRSTLRRVIPGTDPLGYWPMEDLDGATRAASALPGGSPMVLQSDELDWSSQSTITGSAPLPNMSGGNATLHGQVSGGTPGNYPSAGFAVAFTGTPGWTALEVDGLIGIYNLLLVIVSTTVELAGIRASDGGFESIVTSSVDLSTGTPAWVQVDVIDSATANCLDYVLSVNGASVTALAKPEGSGGRVVTDVWANQRSTGNPAAIGHVAVWGATQDDTEILNALAGYSGERAADRFTRLCAENGIASTLIGSAADTARMGPQYVDTLANHLAEIERTEDGILSDTRTARGLTLRTRVSLYNQAAALALSYTAGHIAPPLDPVIDDQLTRNDVTVTRRRGSSARAVQETGPLNVQDPTTDPQGVGRIDTSVELNPDTDVALPDQARWRLAVGTVTDPRYPRVTVDLDAAPWLAAAAAAVRLGDLVTIDDLPARDGGRQARLLVVGYVETLDGDGATRKITYNCVPAAPYDLVATVSATGDFKARVGPDAATLAAAAAIGATSLSVASVGSVWTTTATIPADFPFDIEIGGERITVTAITGAGSPQTFTVTRAVNGIAKAHSSGAAVRLWRPSAVGL